jgi:hypothetical protein
MGDSSDICAVAVGAESATTLAPTNSTVRSREVREKSVFIKMVYFQVRRAGLLSFE